MMYYAFYTSRSENSVHVQIFILFHWQCQLIKGCRYLQALSDFRAVQLEDLSIFFKGSFFLTPKRKQGYSVQLLHKNCAYEDLLKQEWPKINTGSELSAFLQEAVTQAGCCQASQKHMQGVLLPQILPPYLSDCPLVSKLHFTFQEQAYILLAFGSMCLKLMGPGVGLGSLSHSCQILSKEQVEKLSQWKDLG